MEASKGSDSVECSLHSVCPIQTSYYGYVPNLGINIFFAILYGLMICTSVGLLLCFRRKWMGYTLVLAIGSSLELAGYILRTYGHENPWGLTSFTIQLVFLTISPVFMSAS